MTTRYQELENQVKELQKEIDRLKKEEQESKLPAAFRRESAIKFLNEPNWRDCNGMFTWASTPQGEDYWWDISDYLGVDPGYKVPDEAIIQLQKWVIQSYQEQYGV